MSQASADIPESLDRVVALVGALIQRNQDLVAECDSLYDHIERLNHQLTAHAADLHTPTPLASPAQQQLLRDEAQRDQLRLERLRAELDAYLSEIDARLAGRNAYV